MVNLLCSLTLMKCHFPSLCGFSLTIVLCLVAEPSELFLVHLNCWLVCSCSGVGQKHKNVESPWIQYFYYVLKRLICSSFPNLFLSPSFCSLFQDILWTMDVGLVLATFRNGHFTLTYSNWLVWFSIIEASLIRDECYINLWSDIYKES